MDKSETPTQITDRPRALSPQALGLAATTASKIGEESGKGLRVSFADLETELCRRMPGFSELIRAMSRSEQKAVTTAFADGLAHALLADSLRADDDTIPDARAI